MAMRACPLGVGHPRLERARGGSTLNEDLVVLLLERFEFFSQEMMEVPFVCRVESAFETDEV